MLPCYTHTENIPTAEAKLFLTGNICFQLVINDFPGIFPHTEININLDISWTYILLIKYSGLG
jgi:hypothetical protein